MVPQPRISKLVVCQTYGLLAGRLHESNGNQEENHRLESVKVPFTLLMAKTNTMVLVFGFSFVGFSLASEKGLGFFASFEQKQVRQLQNKELSAGLAEIKETTDTTARGRGPQKSSRN